MNVDRFNPPGPEPRVHRLGRLRPIPIIALAILTLVAGTLPAAAAEPPPAEPPPAPIEEPGTDFGGGVDPEERVCDPEPCPETGSTSGGTGGFIAIAPERVFDTTLDANGRMGRRETRSFAVGGVGSVPADGIQAVAVSLAASDATALSSLTVWSAGLPRPSTATLDVALVRPQRIAAIVALGDDGRLSLWNESGRVEVQIDVIGWFAWDTEYRAVTPRRLYDTNPGLGARPAPLGPGGVADVAVTGITGIPADARAVVLAVSSRASTRTSPVTVWPKGADRPAAGSLVAHPLARPGNLVVVAPGADGAVSIHNAVGWTHLTVDVVGWLPAASAYRSITPTTLAPADGADLSRGLAPGTTVDYTVTGVAGIPAPADEEATETAYAVALNITATPRALRATTIVAWPAGDKRPTTTSVTTTALAAPVTSLTFVRVGNEGRVSLFNDRFPVNVRVEVVGWFALPIVAAQLEVPETTVVPAPEEVTPLEVVTAPAPDPLDPAQIVSATVELAPTAPVAKVGGHLVLGTGGVIGTAGVGTAGVGTRLAVDEESSEAFPEGFLGEITAVETAADGTQTVTMVPALLEDVFPEGDIEVNLEADTEYEGQLLWGPAPQEPSVVLASVAPPTKGVKVDFEYVGDGKKGKDPATSAECSMDGITAKFGPLINMQFSVRWRWFKAPVVTALATLGAEAELAVRDVRVNCGVDVRLWKATVTFTAGPVPVVVVFEVGAALDFAAGLEGLNIGAGAGAYVTIGVKANQGFADASYDYRLPALADLKGQLTELNVFGQADVWLHFTVKLYGVIGPRISVGPFIEAVVTAAPEHPWWRLEFGLAGKIALQLDLWFHEWNWDLYEAEIPLADLLVAVGLLENCPPMPYAASKEPCRSVKPARRADGSSGSRVLAGRIRLASAGEGMRILAIEVPTIVPRGRVGDPYSLRLTADGLFDGAADIAWASPSTGVPGLTLRQDGAAAVLEGIPTSAGTFTATVEVRQGWDLPSRVPRDRETIAITVAPPGAGAAPVCGDLLMGDVAWGHGFATTADCTDADGDALTYAVASGPEHGTVTFIGDDYTFEYTAPYDYEGPDNFTFTASDGTNVSEPATFFINVTKPTIVNGDFETGGLAGWRWTDNPGRAGVSGWFVINDVAVVPTDGSWFGLVGTEVEGTTIQRDTAISQDFWADAGDTLSGKAWANSGTANLRIVDANGTTVAVLLSASTWPNWVSWSHAFTDAGIYTLVAETTGTFTFIGLDEVAIAP